MACAERNAAAYATHSTRRRRRLRPVRGSGRPARRRGRVEASWSSGGVVVEWRSCQGGSRSSKNERESARQTAQAGVDTFHFASSELKRAGAIPTPTPTALISPRNTTHRTSPIAHTRTHHPSPYPSSLRPHHTPPPNGGARRWERRLQKTTTEDSATDRFVFHLMLTSRMMAVPAIRGRAPPTLGMIAMDLRSEGGRSSLIVYHLNGPPACRPLREH